jgi:transient receptor potential cation channel subfamily C protein 4
VLDQTRSSKELQTILNYSDETDALPNSGILSALRLAVHFNQKRFVAQPNCQQLLSTLWYEGVYGWRRMHWGLKLLYSLLIGLFWPILCMIHIIFPKSSAGQLICRPFMKFIVGTASYLTFLALLVLASQVKVDHAGDDPGPPPSTIEWILLPWIISLIAAEIGQLWSGGANDYVNDRWNVMDFFMNSLYLATISTKICAFLLHKDIPHHHRLSRVEWDPLHPTLISEALFSVANIFSFLRLSKFTFARELSRI